MLNHELQWEKKEIGKKESITEVTGSKQNQSYQQSVKEGLTLPTRCSWLSIDSGREENHYRRFIKWLCHQAPTDTSELKAI